MKRFILLGLIALASLTSCSKSEEVREDIVILRGKSVVSNVISPLYTTAINNVYKAGDTVWTYKPSGIDSKIEITNSTWKLKTTRSDNFEAFVIEKDSVNSRKPL